MPDDRPDRGPENGERSPLGDALGALSRLSARLRASANQVLDRLEDPDETIANARRRLSDRLERLRRAVARVANAERALHLQISQLQQSAGGSPGPSASTGGTAGRDDDALRQRDEAARSLASLASEAGALESELDALVERCRALAARVESSTAATGTAPAPGEAAPAASSSVRHGLDELSGQLADAESAARRLDQRISATRKRTSEIARALAPRPATDPGALWSIDEELTRSRVAAEVEDELARLKERLRRERDRPGGPGPPGR